LEKIADYRSDELVVCRVNEEHFIMVIGDCGDYGDCVGDYDGTLAVM